MIAKGVAPEDAAALERCGFKLDTAYMEVPVCSCCAFWAEGSSPAWGICQSLQSVTAPRFGCVRFLCDPSKKS